MANALARSSGTTRNASQSEKLGKEERQVRILTCAFGPFLQSTHNTFFFFPYSGKCQLHTTTQKKGCYLPSCHLLLEVYKQSSSYLSSTRCAHTNCQTMDFGIFNRSAHDTIFDIYIVKMFFIHAIEAPRPKL